MPIDGLAYSDSHFLVVKRRPCITKDEVKSLEMDVDDFK